jgi:hypothetical protein
MGIANAVRGKTSYQFQDRSASIAKDADATGYVVFAPQMQQKFAGNCYDASQHPPADQIELLRGIVSQLRRNYYAIPVFYWTVIDVAPNANCLNSSAIAELRTVLFYSVMGKALHWDRDAIASVMAHEVGHIADKYCMSLGQNITPGAYQTPLGQICEKHADNIGIQYALGAGFKPSAFVTTFQVLQRYAPTKTALRYAANHPINQDRITNVGLALETLCKKNIPRACEYAEASTEIKEATPRPMRDSNTEGYTPQPGSFSAVTPRPLEKGQEAVVDCHSARDLLAFARLGDAQPARRLACGTQVTIYDLNPRGWANVKLQDGTLLWVVKDYLSSYSAPMQPCPTESTRTATAYGSYCKPN